MLTLAELGSLEEVQRKSDARCCLCGDHLRHRYFPVQSDRIFSECAEWSDSKEENGHVYGKAADLNKVYFEIPWVWRRVCRAIFQVCQGGSRYPKATASRMYHLSGVALAGPEIFVRAPRDPEEMILGDFWNIPDKFIEAHIGELLGCIRRVNPSGYWMLERCWMMMTHVVDENLIKEHLDLFVNALSQRSKEQDLKGLNAYDLKSVVEEDYQWEQQANNYGHVSWSNIREFTAFYDKKIRYSKRCYKGRDPLNIPEIRNLLMKPKKIQQALERRWDEIKEKEKSTYQKTDERTDRSKLSKPTSSRHARTSSRLSPFSYTIKACDVILPADIVMIIADFFRGPSELRTLLWVFPHWRPVSINTSVLDLSRMSCLGILNTFQIRMRWTGRIFISMLIGCFLEFMDGAIDEES